MPGPEYAELHCISNFTFLRGASHPHELVEQADRQGYRGLALTDECTLAGVVRAHTAARESAIAFMVGSEIRCEDGLSVVVLAPDRRAYAALCSLISCARRRADKGSYACERRDLPRFLETSGCLLLWLANESRSRATASGSKSVSVNRSGLPSNCLPVAATGICCGFANARRGHSACVPWLQATSACIRRNGGSCRIR